MGSDDDRHRCYLPVCGRASRWLVSPTDAPDEDRGACDEHLPRAVSRVSRKHGASPIAVTPAFVIQGPADLGSLLPLVELGASIHGLIVDMSRAADASARDGIRTGAHLTSMPAPEVIQDMLDPQSGSGGVPYA
jgi:hypothetical protein